MVAGSVASGRGSVPAIDGHEELLSTPRWRTRTTAASRRLAAVGTFVVVAAVGSLIVLAITAGLAAVSAPGWVVALPWVVPTVWAVVWSARDRGPATVDDDDQGWTEHAIRLVMVGDGARRPRAIRALAALVFGAPVGWMLLVFGTAALLGIV